MMENQIENEIANHIQAACCRSFSIMVLDSLYSSGWGTSKENSE